jgi:hypothetical protein
METAHETHVERVHCVISVRGGGIPISMKLVAPKPRLHPKKERSMTNQDDEEKKNMRIMWVASGVVVLFIVGLMGLSMLGMLGNAGTGPTDMSSQSRTVPAK